MRSAAQAKPKRKHFSEVRIIGATSATLVTANPLDRAPHLQSQKPRRGLCEKIPVLDDARDFLRAMMEARSLRGIMVAFPGSK
jgi:hypothetical protein